MEKFTDKQIARYTYALEAIQDALSVSEHILTITPKMDSHLFSGMAAGLVVSYTRPFMSANGLGPLEKELENFPDPKLEEIHKLLLHTRNKITAHNDLSHLSDMHETGELREDPRKVNVELTGDGAFFSVPSTFLHGGKIKEIIPLCEYQIDRLQYRLGDAGAYLLKKKGAIGEFTMTIPTTKKD